MKRLPLLFAFLLALSCSNNELRTELRKLDKIIENREVYLNDFNSRVSLLRDSLGRASSDSAAWVYSYRLYESFLRFSTDSALLYLDQMEKYALACPNKKIPYFTLLSRLQLDIARNHFQDATKTYGRIDTAGLILTPAERFEYYNKVGAYFVMVRDASSGEQHVQLRDYVYELRGKAVQIDSVSVTGRKLRAILYNREEKYDKSLETLLPCWSWNTLTNLDRSITAYNIASIYQHMGDERRQMIWLARSAQYDYMVPVNNYLSVYRLAILLYDHKMYKRSQKYINLNLLDIIEANYHQRIRRSGEMQVLISSANNKIQVRRFLIISLISLVFLMMSLVLVSLLRKNKTLYGQMLNVNQKLEEANTIKEEYLFKYMVLSTQYLIRVEETRHELRQIAKVEGVEAMMQKLRGHGNTDEELKKFFKIFDETFLSIFPDFTDRVNDLLRENCRFTLKNENELPTELRILASIRLGMKESGKIAKFLNCAPATVYTYRTKLLNMAAYPREQFEQKLMEITSY